MEKEIKSSREHMIEMIKKRMGKIKYKIPVFSGKGGVGKTTVAVNLSLGLAMKKYGVGILDADIHGPNVPKMLGISNPNLMPTTDGILPIEFVHSDIGKLEVMSLAFYIERDTPVIWRGPLKSSAIMQFLSEVHWGELDFLIVDLPPGTGDELLTIVQLIPNVTGSIIVTTPQDVALLDSRKAVNFSKKVGVEVIGVIENMSGFICPKCHEEINIFKRGGGERSAMELGVKFLGRIPLDPEIVISGDEGKPILIKNPNSFAAKKILEIVEKVESFCKSKSNSI
ncbi:MAG: ATP-binding protein [Candidatus Altiarchaeales archaeon]|nr:MAG: ATP-binding protein [Candidatus Altiarchaeales archaeon]